MKNILLTSLLSASTLFSVCSADNTAKQTCQKSFYLPTWDAKAPHVDAYNFIRAETDIQMKRYGAAGFGKFAHSEKLTILIIRLL